MFSAWHYVLEEDNRLFFSKEKAGKSKDDMVNITWQKKSYRNLAKILIGKKRKNTKFFFFTKNSFKKETNN